MAKLIAGAMAFALPKAFGNLSALAALRPVPPRVELSGAMPPVLPFCARVSGS